MTGKSLGPPYWVNNETPKAILVRTRRFCGWIPKSALVFPVESGLPVMVKDWFHEKLVQQGLISPNGW